MDENDGGHGRGADNCRWSNRVVLVNRKSVDISYRTSHSIDGRLVVFPTNIIMACAICMGKH